MQLGLGSARAPACWNRRPADSTPSKRSHWLVSSICRRVSGGAADTTREARVLPLFQLNRPGLEGVPEVIRRGHYHQTKQRCHPERSAAWGTAELPGCAGRRGVAGSLAPLASRPAGGNSARPRTCLRLSRAPPPRRSCDSAPPDTPRKTTLATPRSAANEPRSHAALARRLCLRAHLLPGSARGGGRAAGKAGTTAEPSRQRAILGALPPPAKPIL